MHSKISPHLLILTVGALLLGTLLIVWSFSKRVVTNPSIQTAEGNATAALSEGSSDSQANWQTLADAFVRSDDSLAKKLVGSHIAFTAEISSFGSVMKARTSDKDQPIAQLWKELENAAREAGEDRRHITRLREASNRLSEYLKTLPHIPCVLRASPEATKRYLDSGGSLSWNVEVTGILRRVDLRGNCIWVDAIGMSGGEVRM